MYSKSPFKVMTALLISIYLCQSLASFGPMDWVQASASTTFTASTSYWSI